ncbi:uncharacterized protein LOC115356780 isoform X2 [Myripristis murdjan]|uniref:uncharacterized protein LOC115356780 isoform X2 n=1 Tax=Myripristis murdjan TaxID=586833 RepID=UPI00117646A3|nr:uncharacterized protein LOC115356780 isoform X2 [Myripristis murdjan]
MYQPSLLEQFIMAQKRGGYQKYLESESDEIPRRTKYRWKRQAKENASDPEEGMSGENTGPSRDLMQGDSDEDSMPGPSMSEEEASRFEESQADEENLEGTGGENEGASRDLTQGDSDEESMTGPSVNEDDPSDPGENLSDDGVIAGSQGAEEDLIQVEADADSMPVSSEDKPTDDLLFPGASFTKKETVLMLMSYVLRHNLTSEAVSHLLEMFNIMFPGLILASHYLFNKEFGSYSDFDVHFYCENCLTYFGIRADCPSQCNSCNTVFDAEANLKKGIYLIVLPLYGQIKQLLEVHDVTLNEKTTTTGVFSDTESGQEYQKLCDTGVLRKDDLSLIWNCDGAPVFKSSKCSIWPIQCQIIELKPEVRKKHVLVSALWFGPGKPSVFTLLTPFVKEASLLEKKGVEWQDVQGNNRISKVFVLISSCDSVARPMLRNTRQFNGRYGCDFCYHEGGKNYPYQNLNLEMKKIITGMQWLVQRKPQCMESKGHLL